MKRAKPISYDQLSDEEISRLELSDNIKRLRSHFNESQQIFATKLGLSIRSLAGYESQGRRPEAKALALFAKVAADAGLHSLADDFLDEIGTGLQLGEMRDGGILNWDQVKGRGYLLVQLKDGQARDHAQGFYRASRAFLFGDKGTKAKAKKLLDQLAVDAVKQIPSQKPKNFVTGSLPPAGQGKKRGKS